MKQILTKKGCDLAAGSHFLGCQLSKLLENQGKSKAPGQGG
jgi:hypothetical protein